MKGILEKLHNPDEFRKVYIDQDAGTVAWPNDLHIDPDTLYNRSIDIHEVENLSKAYYDLRFTKKRRVETYCVIPISTLTHWQKRIDV